MLTVKPCLLLLFLVGSLYGFAQTVQELKKRLDGPLSDSIRLRLFNQVAWLSSPSDSATTFNCADQALRLSSIAGNNFEKAKALMAKGNYFLIKSKGIEASPYFQQALLLYTSLHNDVEIATAKDYLGKAYTF